MFGWLLWQIGFAVREGACRGRTAVGGERRRDWLCEGRDRVDTAGMYVRMRPVVASRMPGVASGDCEVARGLEGMWGRRDRRL